MATVTNTVKLPDGSTPNRVDVVIELVASTTGRAAGWVTATDVTVEAIVRPTVTGGAWTASLTPNADITPSGTVYKVTEYVDRQRYTHYITVDSDGGSLFDLLTDPPATVASSALSAHIAATPDAHDASAISVADTDGDYTGSTVEAVLVEQVTKFAPMRSVLKGRQVPAADKNQAYVAITFDDGHASVYANAYPRMKKLGMVGTLCITTDYIGQSNRMTWAQVREMEADGWEVASHSVSHPSLITLTLSEVIDQLELSKAALYANGVRKVRGFVPPYGLYDSSILAEIRKRFEWNRFNGEDATHPAVWTIDRYNVTAINPGDDLSRFKAALDRAIYNGTYIGPLFHHVMPGASSGNDMNEDEFQSFIEYLAARNVAVGTVSDRLVAGLTPDYDGVDLAYNGNMVHGSSSSSILSYWIRSTGTPTWGVGLDPAYPTLPVVRVTQSDFFDADTPYWAPVSAGSTYLCEMTMKADSTYGAGRAGLIFITWYQSDKATAISNSSNTAITLSASAYRSFVLESTAPANAAFCRIRMRANSSTTAAFVANVSMRKKMA